MNPYDSFASGRIFPAPNAGGAGCGYNRVLQWIFIVLDPENATSIRFQYKLPTEIFGIVALLT